MIRDLSDFNTISLVGTITVLGIASRLQYIKNGVLRNSIFKI